jgi:hypothetical protein
LPRKHIGYVPLAWSLLCLLAISLASFTLPVHAAALPDPTVDSVWLEDASQIGQPVSQSSPGQSFNIIATIKHIGPRGTWACQNGYTNIPSVHGLDPGKG